MGYSKSCSAISPSGVGRGLIGSSAVCAICHDATTKGADTILAVRTGLDDLTGAIDAGEAILLRAERAGMLVDEGRAALRDAREHRIHARVLMHAFAATPFQAMAGQGMRAARASQAVGERALQDLQVRRRGLLAATVVIIGFVVTLGVKIRRLGRTSGPMAGPGSIRRA